MQSSHDVDTVDRGHFTLMLMGKRAQKLKSQHIKLSLSY